MSRSTLVRCGKVPEVFRCQADDGLELRRGDAVVTQTGRGLQLGEVLEVLTRDTGEPEEIAYSVVRQATPEDLAAARESQQAADESFRAWCDRIRNWNLNLELIDVEPTLDRAKEILYVLSDRGPDCTKLALQAAAAGLGIVEVQPVSLEGLVAPKKSGCGSGGCRH